jgi:hypothetical protein
VFWVGAALMVVTGAWITRDWILGEGGIRRWNPGSYLPTAAGGLLGR